MNTFTMVQKRINWFRYGKRLVWTKRPGLLLLATLFLFGCEKESEPDTVVKVVEDNPVVLVTTPVAYKVAAEPVYPGVVQAIRTIDLAFPMAGRLVSRPVKVGDRISPSTVLAVQETDVAKVQQQAASSQTKAQQAHLQWVMRDVQRAQQLMAENFVSPSFYEKSKVSAELARSNVAKAEAEQTVAHKNLKDSVLRSSVSSVVLATLAEPGQLVSAGMPVVRVADDSAIDIVFSVPEHDKENWIKGTEAHVLVLSEKTPHLRSGRVREVSPEADLVTRTYQIKLALNAVDKQGVPLGATVKVGQRLMANGTAQPSYLLPMGALYQLRGMPVVWVVRLDQRLVPLPVKISGYHPRGVIIQAVFAPDSVVVAAGAHLLREDEKVRPEIWKQWTQANLEQLSDESGTLTAPRLVTPR